MASSPEPRILQRFSNESRVEFAKVALPIAAAILAATGILCVGADLAGAPSVSFGIGAGALFTAVVMGICWMRLRPWIVICREDGFSVDGQPGHPQILFCRWNDVREVRVDVIKGDESPDTPYLEVTTPSGLLLGSSASAVFSEELVTVFNDMTPHLPYCWEARKGFWKGLTFEKVFRPAVPPPKKP